MIVVPLTLKFDGAATAAAAAGLQKVDAAAMKTVASLKSVELAHSQAIAMEKQRADSLQKIGMEMARAHDEAIAMGTAMADAAHRAGMEMARLHDEALAMNAAMDASNDSFGKTTTRAGALSDTVGRVSTTLARSADAFGLPIGPLKTLDDVMDVAELGFGNLSKSAAGFNAASIGVAGAGLAIGAAIGTWLRTFPAVAKAADDAAESLFNFFGVATKARGWNPGELEKIQASYARVQAQSNTIQKDAIKTALAQGKSLEEVGEKYKQANPEIQKFIEGLKQQNEEAKRAADAVKSYIAALPGGADDAERVRVITTAMTQLGSSATGAQVRAIAEDVKELGVSFKDTATVISDIPQIDLGLGKIATEFDPIELQLREIQRLMREQDKTFEEAAKAVGYVGKGIGQAAQLTTDWSQVLQNVSNLFNVLGINAESALGGILGGITGVMASLQSLGKSGIKGFGDFFKALKGGMGAGGIATAIVGGLSIGAAAFKTIKGLFSKPEFKKVMSDVGRDWGVSISEGLAKEIEATMKAQGLGRFEASLLHTSDIIAESGRDAREFTEQIDQLFTVTANGSVPAAEGIAQLGESFGLVADAALKAGSVGDKALVGMIKRARELGLAIPEIEEFVKEALGGAAAGVGTAFGEGGIEIVTPEDAKAQAAIFSATFWANVEENGLIAAADAMKPAMDSMVEQLKELGIDPKTILGDVMAQMNLADNEQFRGAAEGAQGLKQTLEGLANSGYLTADSFAAFGQQANAAFEQAKAGGASETQALQAILPLLASMQSAAANYGFTLDANTQSLIEQAKTAGLAFPTDPVSALTDAIHELTEAITGVPRNIDVHTNYSSSGAPPAAPTGPPGEKYPEFAGGGVMSRTGYALLHGTPTTPEYIFTSDQMKGLRAWIAGGGNTGGSVSNTNDNRINLHVDARGATDPWAVKKAVGDAVAELMDRGTHGKFNAALQARARR
jgi:DNA-binding transcriptional MerR regulator